MNLHARRNHYSEHELTHLAERAARGVLEALPAPPAPPAPLTHEEVRAIVREELRTELKRLQPGPGLLRRWWNGLTGPPEPQS